MKSLLRRLASEHSMVIVLLLLCGLFSVLTYTEQPLTGEAGAVEVFKALERLPQRPASVLIAVRDHPEDVMFADRLEAGLKSRGMEVAAVVKGEPRDARAALAGLAAAGRQIDLVAGTEASASWQVFESIPTEFPALGVPVKLSPPRSGWPNFLKLENLVNITNQIAVIAIVAIGMTLVIVTGGIDLSVGSLIALSAVLAAGIVRDLAGGMHATAAGMTASCIAAIAATGLAGIASGVLITTFRVPPFIVTLGMMLIGSGLAYTLAEGQSIYQLPGSFVWLGRGQSWLGVPNAVMLMVLLYGIAHVVMTQTRIGRYFYATGGNREAAVLSGVPVKRVMLIAYGASGMLAGVGGVVMASQLKSGSPTYGSMYELYVIAAAVVGGASLSGGKGHMFGTLTGAFIIAVIQNGMNLTNVESYAQKMVLGGVVLGAVLLDQVRRSPAA